MTKPSPFLKWFVAQHGKRPSKLPLEELQRLHNMAAIESSAAAWRLKECVRWEDQKESALYAWNAAQKARK